MNDYLEVRNLSKSSAFCQVCFSNKRKNRTQRIAHCVRLGC